jgi:hypothetical protein
MFKALSFTASVTDLNRKSECEWSISGFGHRRWFLASETVTFLGILSSPFPDQEVDSLTTFFLVK